MKKCLFLFWGECFREGQSGTRLRDTPYGIEQQIQSSISHMKLANHIKSDNCSVDIAINTYNTTNEEMLKELYSNIVYSNFTKERYDNTNTSVGGAIHNIFQNIDISIYSFIFACRVDLLLKDDLITLFNTDWDKITYPNVMSIRHDDVNDTCISDLFIFIPKKYFTPFNQWNGLLSNANRMLHHHSVQELIRNGLSLNDFEYVTDRTYIANTMQLTNPLYAINCRLEGPTFVNGYSNRRYNKETHTVVDL